MPCIWGSHNNREILIQVCIFDVSQASALSDRSVIHSSLPKQYIALIDTGAEQTMISTRIISELQMTSVGTIPIQNVSDEEVIYHDGYLFHLGFLFGNPHKQRPENTEAASLFTVPQPIFGAEISSSGDLFDVLLGMDIICKGSLHVAGDGSFSFSI